MYDAVESVMQWRINQECLNDFDTDENHIDHYFQYYCKRGDSQKLIIIQFYVD